MTRLWIALKNPPFKREGFDKPMFFNSYWKRKSNLDDESTIQLAMSVFDKQFFGEGTGLSGEIAEAIDFQNFKIRLPKNANQGNEIFRSSFFKVLFGNEGFPRYCWVTETKYVGQNIVEFTLETDLWITFMPQITFDSKRSVACKRRMPERYVIGDKNLIKNPLSIENNFLDSINSPKLYPTKTYNFFFNANITDIWAKYFQFHTDGATAEGTYMYALIKGNGDQKVVNNINQNSANLILPYFIYPIIADDIDIAKMSEDNPEVNNVVQGLTANRYSIFTKAADTSTLAAIFELPIAITKLQLSQGALYEDNTDSSLPIGIRLTTLGMQVFYNNLKRVLTQPIDIFDFKTGKLLDSVITDNEPILAHHQTKYYQIVNGQGNAPLIPAELFLKENFDDQSISFTLYNIINGANNRVLWRPMINNYENYKETFRELYSNEYNYSYNLNSDIPSIVGAWDNYMQNHKSTFYTGAVSGVVNNLLGGALGMTLGDKPSTAGKWSIGLNAVAGSITSIANNVSQEVDLKRQANSVNTIAPDYIQSVMLSEGVNGLDSILGRCVEMNIHPSLIDEILVHYRLFGNPIKDRVNLSFELLQKREFWNYWQLEDVQNTFVFDSIPPFVIDELDKMFSGGIRLWPVWWDANQTYIDTIYNYDLENWETSLKLELPSPTEENNGIL